MLALPLAKFAESGINPGRPSYGLLSRVYFIKEHSHTCWCIWLPASLQYGNLDIVRVIEQITCAAKLVGCLPRA